MSAGRGDASAGDVGGWTDVVAIAAGSHYTVAPAADASVLMTDTDVAGQCDVSSRREVVHVAAGAAHTLGVRADGTVLAAGEDSDGQCAVVGRDPRRTNS